MENKVIDFNIVDGKFIVVVDPNKNGVAVIRVELNLAEIPSEVLSLFSKPAVAAVESVVVEPVA
jgi:hypothetical protein